MTAAAAEIPRPARPARLLYVNVTIGEPAALPFPIDPGADAPQACGGVLDETVARV
jgi:hypothetical protein